MRHSKAALLAALFCLSFTQSSVTEAQTSENAVGGVRPEVHLSLGGHGDFGAGFRIDIPIVREGLIRGANDELALSPGLDLQFVDFNHHAGDDDVLVIPQLAVQWNFYLPHNWSLFPELGIAPVFGARHGGYSHHRGDDFHVDPLIAFGARYHFSPRNALVMRVGFPSGFQLGLTF